jgi:hypothetical protein
LTGVPMRPPAPIGDPTGPHRSESRPTSSERQQRLIHLKSGPP